MYIITGATGNTGSRISESLLASGHAVKAIARNPEKLSKLQEKGATIVAGDLSDAEFLTQTLKGATAAYLMIPPNFAVQDWRAHMTEMVDVYTRAVRESGIKKVVLLSSIGAHRTDGLGPIGGLAELENAMKAIPGLDVLALRPGYFMENLYGAVGMIKHMGINGGVQRSDVRTSFVHTSDIAAVATQRLLDLNFTGFSYEFITGPEDLTFGEITAIIGQAIGKPDLPYVNFSPADGKAGMIQAGLPETIANGYVELAEGMNKGLIGEGYDRATATRTNTSFAWFAEHELKRAF
jgi:uncharacterized protein YbjT (DUF2867 family)